MIAAQIGAELAVILKTRQQLETAARENSFGGSYDPSRVHLVFTNDLINDERLGWLDEAYQFSMIK